jgi:hypothetical protein
MQNTNVQSTYTVLVVFSSYHLTFSQTLLCVQKRGPRFEDGVFRSAFSSPEILQ